MLQLILTIVSYIYISNAFKINNSKYAFTHSSLQKFSLKLENSNTQTSVGDSDDATVNTENSQITRLFELIVTSLEDGREDDLVKAGLKVTKKSARETLDSKINDPKLQDLILGSMNDPDEIDVMQRLQQVYQQEEAELSSSSTSSIANSNNINFGYDDDAGEIDEDVLNELRQEAYQTLQIIRQKSNGVSAMGALLDDPEAFSGSSSSSISSNSSGAISNVNEFKGFGSSNSKTQSCTQDQSSSQQEQQQPFDPSVWGQGVGVASLLSPIDINQFPEFADTPISDSSSNYNGPPTVEIDVMEVSDEEDVDNDDVDVGAGAGQSSSRRDGNSASGRSSSALYMAARDDDDVDNRNNSDSNKVSAVPTEADATALSAVGESPEAKFAALLRASMTMQQVQTEAEAENETITADGKSTSNGTSSGESAESIAERRRRTVDAVTVGRVDKLDMDALLGKTMATLAKQLDIDVQSSLTEKESLQQMQSIIGSGMAELTQGLSEVDAQSQALYLELENMQMDLRNETEIFEQTKQMELDMFMKSQKVFQNEVVLSQKRMQNTTDTLKNLVQSLEEEADVLSAIVLFPLKSTDKKIAFVFGLALFFKVPFDGIRVALNSLDSSDWFGVLIQAAVCLACFNHYGLLKAAFQNNSGGLKQS